MTVYAANPFIIMTPGTTEGTITDAPYGLVGVELLGQTGAACDVQVSADGGVTWTTVTYPHTLAAGGLRFVRAADETGWTILRARVIAAEPSTEPVVWTITDLFDRPALGANYSEELYRNVGRVDSAATVPPGLIVHFPAFTGDTPGYSGTVVTLADTAWNDPGVQVEFDLDFAADPWPANQFGMPVTLLYVEGVNNTLYLDIGGKGNVYLYTNNGGNLAQSALTSLNGLWRLTVDTAANKIEVQLNGVLLMSIPIPTDLVTEWAGQGRIRLDIGRQMTANGNLTVAETSVTVHSLKLRSGTGHASPPPPPNPDGSVTVGSMTVNTSDHSKIWFPTDYATAGTQIFGPRDDSADVLAIPSGGHVTWAGTDYTSLTHDANGGIIFDGQNFLRWNYGPDWYEQFRREINVSGDLAWVADHGPYSGAKGGTLSAIRQYADGSWSLTTAQNSNGPITGSVMVGGHPYNFTVPDGITLADDTTWHVIYIKPVTP